MYTKDNTKPFILDKFFKMFEKKNNNSNTNRSKIILTKMFSCFHFYKTPFYFVERQPAS